MDKYVVLEKQVGETPFSCLQTYRQHHPELTHVPMAYAGRLDPMASGKLLVLLGEECKQQTNYHNLDKEYEFSILFGLESDTHDVLGRLFAQPREADSTTLNIKSLEKICHDLIGNITLPYPHFSSKTVAGKPLHTWTLEERLSEIEIPTKSSTIYSLVCTRLDTLSRSEVVSTALAKINTIPPVTDPRKELGRDFRRDDIRADWQKIAEDGPENYQVAHLLCTASSGTYMRSLAHLIGQRLGIGGLAWYIHRTKIGTYHPAGHWQTIFQ